MNTKEIVEKINAFPLIKIIIIGFIIIVGLALIAPRTKIIYQDKITYQDRIVEKQVVTNDCKREQSQIEIYKEVLDIDNRAMFMASNIILKSDYYDKHIDELQDELYILKKLSEQKWTLINEDFTTK